MVGLGERRDEEGDGGEDGEEEEGQRGGMHRSFCFSEVQ